MVLSHHFVFVGLMMAVTIIRKENVVKTDYTILDALKEFQDKNQVLMLVHRTSGEDYQVLAYDPNTGQACLKGKHKQKLNPRITEREIASYYPVWR